MNLFSEQTILTVSRLTALLTDLLEENFSQVWVEGEVSNLAQPSSGHLYFTLKDSGAMIRCVLFRSSVKSLKFRLEEGMSLILRGRVSVYGQRGDYQLVGEYAEPKGLGALQAAFIQLKEQLSAEGLFDQMHKQPLPEMPQRVAVVTSPTGAVVHDILNVLGRRHAGVQVLIYPVRVQGEGSALEIVKAIHDLNRIHAADVLIVARGGGSLEDLWAFNEEIVARAVFSSKIPVISAVGHETDWTICDFVADLRAPTPSAAAELVSAARDELQQQLEGLYHRLQQAMQTCLKQQQRSLESLKRALHDPGRMMGHLSQRCDDLDMRLHLGMRNLLLRLIDKSNQLHQQLYYHDPVTRIRQFRQQLELLSVQADHHIHSLLDHLGRAAGESAARLHGLSPLQTLARGFAVAERISDQRIVRSALELKAGDELLVRLHQGQALCTVEESYNDSGVKATT